MEYCTSFRGLQKWHEAMYEKLGWMVLAKAKGRNTKVKAYLESISHLETSLKDRIKVMKSMDKKLDLECILQNVKLLKKVSNKLLK
jgi:hypothetical protein